MPIPTDTLWNIRRLNWLFALSAVLLLVVTSWSIVQDYAKDWRIPQRHTRVWQAAMVEEKIDRQTTTEKQRRLADLDRQIAEKQASIGAHSEQTQQLNRKIRQLEDGKAPMEFELNLAKSELGVAEGRLQDAVAAGDAARASKLQAQLEPLRAKVLRLTEAIAAANVEIQAARQELAERTRALDDLRKQHALLSGDSEMLRKKLLALEPSRQGGLPGLLGTLSTLARRMPLLQFVNPVERPQHVILTDVLSDLGGFKKVESIDRCTTCHTNINKPEFSEAAVVAFLEEQAAAAQGLVLPQQWTGKSADPAATESVPGPVALPGFWHYWAWQLAPGAISKNKTRITQITKPVGWEITVLVDGEPLSEFTFDPEVTDDAEARRQEAALVQLLQAVMAQRPVGDGKPFVSESPAGQRPQVRVEIAPDADQKALETARKAAMRYVEEVAAAVRDETPAEQRALLEDRYRYALTDQVNAFRGDHGLAALDPSPVLLAHPQLDLYVSQDGPHPTESEQSKIGMGCTSCHDGSGLETDFVLAAHVARPIWVDEKTGEPVLPAQLRPTRPIEPEHKADLASMLRVLYPQQAIVPDRVRALHPDLGTAAEKPTAEEKVHVPSEAPEEVAPVPYVDPVTGKSGRAVSQFAHWRRAYEPKAPRSFELVYHEWDRPMLPPKYIEANCVRCHTASYDIAEHAPVVHKGRTLFKNMGCANCHTARSIAPEVEPTDQTSSLVVANGQRKVGTDLRHITSKLSPAMINTWIWAPKAFRPSTRMPHFFMLENNSSSEEVRRTTQEARSITEYLMQTADPLTPGSPLPANAQGSVDAGRALFNSVGCIACHTNLGDTTAATRKTAAGTRPVTVAEEWIVNDLIESGRLTQQIAARTGQVPDKKALKTEAEKTYDAMSYNERQVYVLENLGVEGALDERPTYPSGKPRPMFVHHGPELSGIGTKLLAGGRGEAEAQQWLYDWVQDPRHYSGTTVMPDLRLTPQQALDLVAHLLAQRRTADDSADPWQARLAQPDTAKLIELTSFFLRSRYSPSKAVEKADDPAELLALAADALVTGSTDKPAALARAQGMTPDQQRMVFLGKKLIGHYGCMSCHAINGTEAISSPCTDLSDWGVKGVDKLDFGYVDEHKHQGPHALPEEMPVALVNGLSPHAPDLLDRTTAGADASPRTDVAWPEVAHRRTAWLTQKLGNTRIYDRGRALLEPSGPEAPGRPYDKLKMPTFFLDGDQIDALVTFVISNRDQTGRDQLISSRLHAQATHAQALEVAQGRMLTEKYNCFGCHQIEGNVPAVQQYYKSDELTTKAPPSLRGEGSKVRHDWLFGFLKNVEPLRPVPVIRMPTFPLQDAEISAIAAYFHAVTDKESRQLRKSIDPIMRYIAAEMKASDEPLYVESAWPGDDWFTRAEFAMPAARLVSWALAHGQITPLQLDPTKNTPDELALNHRMVLYKARFTAELYDAPFPFTDAPQPVADEERFGLGEKLFYEMQCLKCHVLEDPKMAGIAAAPPASSGPSTTPAGQQAQTAPNLALAHRRLQRRWMRHWVQEPPVIQTGTAMPPFFTGLPVFSQGGQSWPLAQPLGDPAQQAAFLARVHETYGDTADEQTDLLLDFVLTAGIRGYTARTPAPAATAPATNAEAATQPSASMVHPEFGKPILPGRRPEAAPPEGTSVVAPATAESAPGAPQGVTVSGKVTFTGTPPQAGLIDMSAVGECAALHADAIPDPSITVSPAGEIRDVVLWIDGIEGPFAAPAQPAALDQRGCMYEPHVLAMQTGQTLLLRNSDPFLHNVHSLSQENPPFNFGQPNVDPGRTVGAMKAAELFRVKCDVHPWMSAYIRVFDHPFFATSAANGTFTIKDVPPGTYAVRAWHEVLGTQQAQLTVEAGKPAEVNIAFTQASGQLPTTPWQELRLAMVGQSSEAAAESCPACANTSARVH
jgi:cytochrome c